MESQPESELLQRHRKEKKDLQAKIQALKKTATKGDKKKKKEVAEEIQKLEDDLNRKHAEELANSSKVDEVVKQTDNLSLQNGKEDELHHRHSKAQRRREKKATELKERELRIAEQEEQNIFGNRNVETNTIKSLLKERNLSIKQIPSDGNCLYCAVEDQLKQKSDKTPLTVADLREKTSEVLRRDINEFLPFLSHPDTGEMLTESQYLNYCDQVRDTTSWGGHVELKALSKSLGCKIEVIQGSGPPVVSGEKESGPHLVLTYHRHMFGLGEHYNSTKPYCPEDEETEG